MVEDMFSVKDAKGKFIYPNTKTYVGIAEFETTDDVYFNIDSREHEYVTGDEQKFKIVSVSEENIKNAKRLRIETQSFETYDEAASNTYNYLTSFKINLAMSGYSPSYPIKHEVKEVYSPLSYVGIVDIELLNNITLPYEERERFCEADGVWYRLYSKNSLPIKDDSFLCVESSAFKDAEVAKIAMDKLLPALDSFLKNIAGNCYKLSESCVIHRVSANVNANTSVKFSAKLSKRTPFDDKLSKIYSIDNTVKEVLTLLECRGLYDLPNLYTIYDEIREAMGSIEKIEELGLASKDDIDVFTTFVNRKEYSGVEHSRHGKTLSRTVSENFLKKWEKLGKAGMVEECRKIMKDLIVNWLNTKTDKSATIK